jgi:Tat protein secretion system quality control protein TatD with DNase activity
MCSIVADVKGWDMQQAAQQLADNFNTFYQDQL